MKAIFRANFKDKDGKIVHSSKIEIDESIIIESLERDFNSGDISLPIRLNRDELTPDFYLESFES